MPRLRMLNIYSFFIVALFPIVGMGEITAVDEKPTPINPPAEAAVVEKIPESTGSLPPAQIVLPQAPVPTPANIQPAAKVEPAQSQQPGMLGLRSMSDSEFNSAMCVMGAAISMAATYAVGPNEVIMLVVGGMVVPSSPSILFVSLFSTMAAAGCTIGESSTPAVSWLYQNHISSK